MLDAARFAAKLKEQYPGLKVKQYDENYSNFVLTGPKGKADMLWTSSLDHEFINEFYEALTKVETKK